MNSPIAMEQERDLYRLLVVTRQLDVEAVRWQRQGLLPGYAPLLGQEATQVGVASVVDATRDFVFPTYREAGVAVVLGVDLVGYMATHLGSWNGGSYDGMASRFTPVQSVVGATAPHAAGWALGQKLDGRDGVALAFFGDGASSQGDVHEAMNFAGVMGLPVVFVVQNNGWAISVPAGKQVAGGSVAARAAGYGFPGEVVDGNDVIAVRDIAERAFARARAGDGPTLIEAMTYRRGPHSTSDDPGRYRTLDEEREAAGEDPIERYRRSLGERGVADEAFFAAALAEAEARVEQVRQGLLSFPPYPGDEIFRHVYARPTAELREQQQQWREESQSV